MPLPPDNLIDEGTYALSLAQAKDVLNHTLKPGMARFHEPTVNYHFYVIRNKKPVNMAAFQAQIKKLYDEECTILCEIGQLRLDGKVDFEFDLP